MANTIPVQAEGDQRPDLRFRDLDNLGLTMWSKWRSAKGALVVLVYRCRDIHGIAQEMELLDVQRETIAKAHARDVVAWIQKGWMTRQ
ncbi:hypothetical protein UFOVP350_26 [uncultured Caudovirales phage]|uniref:Uncharacterized protein n=1 Tax=uncultured Caudovirales phage TaxID=2100421 RepID=A0A6J5LWL9_9CAUD|nr:hypothetical protein UFOVP350_26 [uncultured Caudovirales phage]